MTNDREFMPKRGMRQRMESDDNLARAQLLLEQGVRGRRSGATSEDIGELFLAHLRERRTRLREWIDVVIREAGDGAAVPGKAQYATSSRRRAARKSVPAARRRPAAARPV